MRLRATAVLFFVSSVAALTSTAASAEAKNTCDGAPDAFVCQCELGIGRKANQMRRAAGKPALAFDEKISYVSRLWSQEQARRGEISHDWSMDGTWDRKYRTKWRERSPMAGENVAMNMRFESPEECATKLSEQWRNSPGHYGNIIDADFRTIGVGVARKANGQWYATQNFGR